jgi:LacI family transcriptional regulator
MPVTIYEVAEKAGVGVGTVSRVLNPNLKFFSKTRACVLQVLKAQDHHSHFMAQRSASQKALTVAVLVSFFTGQCYLKLLKGIQQIISQLIQYDVALCKDQSGSMNSPGDGGRRCRHC